MRFAIALGVAIAAARGQTMRTTAADFPAPDALKSSAVWDSPGFLAEWSAASVTQGEEHRVYRGRCQIFGHQAQAVTGLFDEIGRAHV